MGGRGFGFIALTGLSESATANLRKLVHVDADLSVQKAQCCNSEGHFNLPKSAVLVGGLAVVKFRIG